MFMPTLVVIGSVIRNFVSTPGASLPPRGAGGHVTALVIMTKQHCEAEICPTTPHLSRSVQYFRLYGVHASRGVFPPPGGQGCPPRGDHIT